MEISTSSAIALLYFFTIFFPVIIRIEEKRILQVDSSNLNYPNSILLNLHIRCVSFFGQKNILSIKILLPHIMFWN